MRKQKQEKQVFTSAKRDQNNKKFTKPEKQVKQVLNSLQLIVCDRREKLHNLDLTWLGINYEVYIQKYNLNTTNNVTELRETLLEKELKLNDFSEALFFKNNYDMVMHDIESTLDMTKKPCHFKSKTALLKAINPEEINLEESYLPVQPLAKTF